MCSFFPKLLPLHRRSVFNTHFQKVDLLYSIPQCYCFCLLASVFTVFSIYRCVYSILEPKILCIYPTPTFAKLLSVSAPIKASEEFFLRLHDSCFLRPFPLLHYTVIKPSTWPAVFQEVWLFKQFSTATRNKQDVKRHFCCCTNG